MSKCKRMTVIAIGIRENYIQKATNYNETECKNIPGACGCIHAEINLLKKINPFILIVSHSPCLNCAKALLKSDVQIVIYKKEYRLTDGLDLLKKNNIQCIQLKEKISEGDIKKLMGMNRDRYGRGRGGAIRKK